MHEGQLKYDRHNLVWICAKEKWIPVLDQGGKQVKYSEAETALNGFRLMQFPAAEDPSGADPRIIEMFDPVDQRLTVLENRLIVIEQKIDELLLLLGIDRRK